MFFLVAAGVARDKGKEIQPNEPHEVQLRDMTEPARQTLVT